MTDGFGNFSGIAKQMGDELMEIPKDIAVNAVDQVMGTDSGQKAAEEEQAQDDTNANQNNQNFQGNQNSGLAQAHKERESQERIAQIRLNMVQIEADMEQERQNRMKRKEESDEEWEARMKHEDQVKQVQSQKALDRIEQMINLERTGETGKRTG